ncbi:MAG: aldo/keto reductase [Bacilli bacterium]|nr:aldo/keto reductase [Bacilli bacterium]MBN2696758.1 aldo/keto reductase [Bacilli bacterium]
MDGSKKDSQRQKSCRLGFGGWQLGNERLWGSASSEEGVELVRSAIESGIVFFDTAPGYADGNSESIIGEAIHDCRKQVIVSSKFGHTHTGSTDFRTESILPSVESSLERLGSDYLDFLLLHNPSKEILSGITGHFEILDLLKQSGIIRGFGVSIDTKAEMDLVLDNSNCDAIEILFNVFFQEPKDLFSKAKQKGVKLIAKVPLDSGWLSGKYNQDSKFTGIRSRWTKDQIIRRSDLIAKVKQIVNDDNLTKYAIAFILSFPEIDYVIPGMKNTKQLKENVAAAEFELEQGALSKLQDLYEAEIRNNPLPW